MTGSALRTLGCGLLIAIPEVGCQAPNDCPERQPTSSSYGAYELTSYTVRRCEGDILVTRSMTCDDSSGPSERSESRTDCAAAREACRPLSHHRDYPGALDPAVTDAACVRAP